VWQADLDWLHDKAHPECFIANSVTTKISVVRTKRTTSNATLSNAAIDQGRQGRDLT
jgi:hypothetical protein